MKVFGTRKPRMFNHPYMFVDERKDKLRAAEQRVRRELGMLPELPYDPRHLKGVFSGQCRHLTRWTHRNVIFRSGSAFFLIFILLILWHYLATGVWRF